LAQRDSSALYAFMSAARSLKVCSTYGTIKRHDDILTPSTCATQNRPMYLYASRVASTRDYRILIMAESIKF